jgi:sugar (pentulose or hexulose) kinase
MTGTHRGESHAIEWTWSRQAKRIVVMTGMGFVFFWVIVLPYYYLAHEPRSFLTQAVEGGTFLAFAVLMPCYLLFAWIRRRVAVGWERRHPHSPQVGQ